MKKFSVILFLICICVFCSFSIVYAEINYVLQIEGIEGESKISEYEGWIDVLTWSWQMSNPSSPTVPSIEKPIVRPLIVTKYIDKASPLISIRLLTGQVIDEINLVALKSGANPFEMLRIRLDKAWFVNVSSEGTTGDSSIVESVALSFSKVCYKYTPQKEDGSPDASIERCFNIETNTQE